MSDECVTIFVVTIFNVSKHDKPFIDGMIEISYENEKYSFNLDKEEKQSQNDLNTIFPRSCSFHTNNNDNNNNNNNNNNNLTYSNIKITISKYNCFVDVPIRLYFDDKIIHQFVMNNNNNNNNDNNKTSIIDLIPPTITLSITSIIPLPFIMTQISNHYNDNDHLMYNYINNNVSSPIYCLNLQKNNKNDNNKIEYKIYNLISQFIDNSEQIVANLNDNSSDPMWDKIKKYIKNKNHRHMTLIAVFYKINKINNNNDIENKHNKYIISKSTYKLLYRFLHKVLDYANPNNTNTTNDVITFYLVLSIGRISYYHHGNCLNCVIVCYFLFLFLFLFLY